MSTATAPHTAESLTRLDEQFSRNFIGGQWRFPAAPYEFEIRNPGTSDIIAVVPLSSRFDVSDAVAAGVAALASVSPDRSARVRKLRRVLDEVARRQHDFAELQSLESGLALHDSTAVVRHAIAQARFLLSCEAVARIPERGGVSGHILSWGLPFTEVLSTVMPALLDGQAVVVKPSLRAPLSAAAFAHVADLAGLEPGLVNVVQGTGGDVGAELISRRDLCGLHVRGGSRTMSAARRARTDVPLTTVTTGGNLVAVGDGALDDLPAIAQAIGNLVRMGSAGGPLTLPLVAVARGSEDELLSALTAELGCLSPAPLPTEALRDRAVVGIHALVDAGASPIRDGSLIPDDIPHRMGWRMPATLLRLGPTASAATQLLAASPPLGPVLGLATYDEPGELSQVCDSTRAEGGVAWLQGVDDAVAATMPHGLVVTDRLTGDLDVDLRLAPTWFRGVR